MTTAIVGRIGSGKTYTAKGRVEVALAAGRRVCIVDPTGAWWGLRLTADGEPSPFDLVIFGGDHADVPIVPDHGERLADLIVSGSVPQAIVDISEFSGNEQHSFLTPFFERLYQKNRAALELVLDEADSMAPQNPLPETRRLLGAVDKIARRGRIRGLALTTITQRPAVLHKNVLSQASTLIAMQLTSPQDRKAVEEWVKGNADADAAREVLGSLASLKRGEGWEWTPGEGVLERRQFPAISTYDSSRTPEHGESVPDVAPIARADMAKLREIFAPSNEAEKIIADPRDAEIARLRDAAKGATVITNTFKAEVSAAEARGRTEGLREAAKFVDAQIGRLQDAVNATIEKLTDQIIEWRDADKPAPATPSPKTSYPPFRSTPSGPPKERRSGDIESAPPGETKLLDILDAHFDHPLTPAEIAIIAGFAPAGGGFRRAWKAIVETGEVVLTDGTARRREISASAKRFEIDPAKVIEMWVAKLSDGAGLLLRELFTRGGELRNEQLAQHTGYAATGGGFRRALKKLRTSGLVDHEPGKVRLIPLLNPRGQK